MRHHRAILLLAAALLAATLPAEAQRAPRRPRLAADADTNDASAYYQFGVERLERDATTAGAAFYWAMRLDPASAQAWYGAYAAQLARDKQRLVKYFLRDARTLEGADVKALDSLRLRAFALDPFMHRGLEEPLITIYAREAIPRDQWMNQSSDVSNGVDRGRNGMLDRFLYETDPYLAGLVSYGRGEPSEAARLWGGTLTRREVDFVYADRAIALVEMRRLDSARASASRAVELARGGAGGDPRHVWETRAGFQVLLGRILEEQRNMTGAREYYQNALASNIAFYPANIRVAMLAIKTADTASAIDALGRELGIVPDDYYVHATLGTIYTNRHEYDSALVHLRKATELEPYASAAWLLFARTLDASGDTGQAALAFERYLAAAPRSDMGRILAQRRLDALRGGSTAAPRP